ncbi:MAG TPA: hypothetical protein VIL28_00640 [Steroidobacteraceae bacterium]
MRVVIALASLLLLSGCGAEITSDPVRVFQEAFGMQEPPEGVVPLHGYQLERQRFFSKRLEMWRLHLGGPRAQEFVRERWPDLEATTVRAFVQGTQTPWFAPGREIKYVNLVSKSDPAVLIMLQPQAQEVFIAYDPRY